jgi:hypothetical protein
MKQLTWKLVLPLTLISFVLWTKWWMVYALPVDGPDIIMVGFPLTYAGDGWHTSMSLQIFYLELVIDLLTYFLFWFIVILIVDRFVVTIRPHRVVTIIMQSVAGACALGLIFIGSNSDNVHYFKRPYDIEVLDSGHKFHWEGNPRPLNFDYEEYERRKAHPPAPSAGTSPF